jgi:hypothetical protein
LQSRSICWRFRYPKARTDIFNAFEKGAFNFNYLGHGGEDGLAAERTLGKIRQSKSKQSIQISIHYYNLQSFPFDNQQTNRRYTY